MSSTTTTRRPVRRRGRRHRVDIDQQMRSFESAREALRRAAERNRAADDAVVLPTAEPHVHGSGVAAA